MDVVPGFPRVMFNSESVPLDQVMQFLIDYSAIQDLFYDPFFFSINDFWEWGEVCVDLVLSLPVLGLV